MAIYLPSSTPSPVNTPIPYINNPRHARRPPARLLLATLLPTSKIHRETTPGFNMAMATAPNPPHPRSSSSTARQPSMQLGEKGQPMTQPHINIMIRPPRLSPLSTPTPSPPTQTRLCPLARILYRRILQLLLLPARGLHPHLPTTYPHIMILVLMPPATFRRRILRPTPILPRTSSRESPLPLVARRHTLRRRIPPPHATMPPLSPSVCPLPALPLASDHTSPTPTPLPTPLLRHMIRPAMARANTPTTAPTPTLDLLMCAPLVLKSRILTALRSPSAPTIASMIRATAIAATRGRTRTHRPPLLLAHLRDLQLAFKGTQPMPRCLVDLWTAMPRNLAGTRRIGLRTHTTSILMSASHRRA